MTSLEILKGTVYRQFLPRWSGASSEFKEALYPPWPIFDF
jgi:hypothetical protein